MANVKDISLLISILAASGVIFFGTGIVDLPGSQTTNLLCNTPVVSNFVDECRADVQPGSEYRVTSCIDLNGEVESLPDPNTQGIVESSFNYETEEVGTTSLSFASLPELSLSGLKDAKVEYRARDTEGKIIATDAKYLGEIGSDENVERCFQHKAVDGNYDLEFILSGTGFGIFGETGEQRDTFQTEINVPGFGGR